MNGLYIGLRSVSCPFYGQTSMEYIFWPQWLGFLQAFSKREVRVESFKKTVPLTGVGLFHDMEEILGNWIGLSAIHLGEPVEGLSPLFLEESVSLEMPSLQLVIRSTPDLAIVLANEIKRERAKILEPKEAFHQLVKHYAGRLIRQFYFAGIPSEIISKTSSPECWPTQKPMIACAVLVEKIPIEIRLWLGDY